MIVSISGLSGSGKSTLAKQLAIRLNWPYVSAGRYFRDIAKNKNVSVYEISTLAIDNFELDREITVKVQEEIKVTKNCILDAHGAALIAKKFQQVCIFLYCPLSIRANRVSCQTKQNYSLIYECIEKLDKETIQRFERVYNQNILNLDHYDLILNTDRLHIEQIVTLVSEFIMMKTK